MITIIDYGVGNLVSIKNMLKKAGFNSVISNSNEEIYKAEKMILPGVGSFDHGMENLHNSGLVEILKQKVLKEKVPILGICLGVQLFTEKSEEGIRQGLGWINGETVKFKMNENSELKVPNMGWNEINIKKHSQLFENMPSDPRFYFVHSYHLKLSNSEDCLIESKYGYNFVAGVEKDNIFGVQFHPEKSHKYGLNLLKNFALI